MDRLRGQVFHLTSLEAYRDIKLAGKISNIGVLFEATVPTVNEHVANIYQQGEITQEANVRNIRFKQRGVGKLQGILTVTSSMPFSLSSRDSRREHFAMFSRSGFTDEMSTLAVQDDVLLVNGWDV